MLGGLTTSVFLATTGSSGMMMLVFIIRIRSATAKNIAGARKKMMVVAFFTNVLARAATGSLVEGGPWPAARYITMRSYGFSSQSVEHRTTLRRPVNGKEIGLELWSRSTTLGVMFRFVL